MKRSHMEIRVLSTYRQQRQIEAVLPEAVGDYPTADQTVLKLQVGNELHMTPNHRWKAAS